MTTNQEKILSEFQYWIYDNFTVSYCKEDNGLEELENMLNNSFIDVIFYCNICECEKIMNEMTDYEISGIHKDFIRIVESQINYIEDKLR